MRSPCQFPDVAGIERGLRFPNRPRKEAASLGSARSAPPRTARRLSANQLVSAMVEPAAHHGATSAPRRRATIPPSQSEARRTAERQRLHRLHRAHGQDRSLGPGPHLRLHRFRPHSRRLRQARERLHRLTDGPPLPGRPSHLQGVSSGSGMGIGWDEESRPRPQPASLPGVIEDAQRSERKDRLSPKLHTKGLDHERALPTPPIEPSSPSRPPPPYLVAAQLNGPCHRPKARP